jgi:hypothetical protein
MNLKLYFNRYGNDEVYLIVLIQVESYEETNHPIAIWRSWNDPTPNYLIREQDNKAEWAAIKHFRHIYVSHKKCLLVWTCQSPSLHLFIHPSTSITWLPLNELSWTLILDIFIHILLKPDKNPGRCTWRPKYVYIVDSNTKYFVAWQQCKRNPLLQFHRNTQQFYTAYRNMWHNNTKETHCCILKVALSICLHCWHWHIQFNNTQLCFHGITDYANAPQCYVMCTLSTLSIPTFCE